MIERYSQSFQELQSGNSSTKSVVEHQILPGHKKVNHEQKQVSRAQTNALEHMFGTRAQVSILIFSKHKCRAHIDTRAH